MRAYPTTPDRDIGEEWLDRHADQYAAVGIPEHQAYEWRDIPPDVAGQWHTVGLTPYEARQWRDTELPLDVALNLARRGYTPDCRPMGADNLGKNFDYLHVTDIQSTTSGENAAKLRALVQDIQVDLDNESVRTMIGQDDLPISLQPQPSPGRDPDVWQWWEADPEEVEGLHSEATGLILDLAGATDHTLSDEETEQHLADLYADIEQLSAIATGLAVKVEWALSLRPSDNVEPLIPEACAFEETREAVTEMEHAAFDEIVQPLRSRHNRGREGHGGWPT